jgi:hypothetical protein
LLVDNSCAIFGLKVTWLSFIGGQKTTALRHNRTKDILFKETFKDQSQYVNAVNNDKMYKKMSLSERAYFTVGNN